MRHSLTKLFQASLKFMIPCLRLHIVGITEVPPHSNPSCCLLLRVPGLFVLIVSSAEPCDLLDKTTFLMCSQSLCHEWIHENVFPGRIILEAGIRTKEFWQLFYRFRILIWEATRWNRTKVPNIWNTRLRRLKEHGARPCRALFCLSSSWALWYHKSLKQSWSSAFAGKDFVPQIWQAELDPQNSWQTKSLSLTQCACSTYMHTQEVIFLTFQAKMMRLVSDWAS